MFLKFIQTSTTGVLQTFGKFTRTLEPGIRFYIPIIQKITPVSNRLRQNTFRFEVKTKDNVFADMKLAIQYKILPENTASAFFSFDDPVAQIDSYIENIVRSEVPKLTLDQVFASQDSIGHSVEHHLSEKMYEYGFTIENTLVTEIDPSSEVKKAMNRINASERLKEAAKNEADAHYIKEIRQAEADSERKRLQGVGISKQRLEILQGYEVGIDQMAGRFGLSAKDIIDFVRQIQELDTMESIGRSTNSKVLFFNQQKTGGIKYLQANEATK